MAQESRLVIVIDAKNAERNARNLGNELDSIERKGDFATKSMDALSVATRQLAGYMAGLVTVSAAISKMDTYTGLQNRLKLVTNNQVELNKATEDTFRIAQKTYSAWDSVLQVYQRFSDNAKTLNLTMDDTARLTETVSKAVAISGASAAAADAALVQFGQALASGTLRGEELNSVMEQTPALAKAIAQGMGITVGELRTVAAEGKITSQEIVKALKNVQADVDALFAKTDITISQSLTLLNNEITKFVGESGKGSGAAEVLSGSIKTLAGNLDVLTSAMMVGGAYWLGTYIPAIYASGVAVAAKTKELAAQTFAQYTAIQADRAAAAQQVLSTQAVVANTQATLAAIAAEKALEVQRLKSQITEKGRTATITRMAELKKIEAQVTRELAVAEEALAVAQSRSAAAGAATVGIGSRLLGLLGGPVGIGITVASLAAGYLLMRDNTNEANKKLEEQAAVAKKAKEELLALKGLEKDSAINDMTASFERQNQALAESSSKINIQLNAIAQLYKGNKEIVQVVSDARDGTISMNDAVKRFNELRISKDIYNALKENSSEFEKNAKEAKTTKESLKLFGIEVELSGRKAQTAVAGIDDNSKALIGNESAAQKATKAQKGYFDSLRAEVLKSNEELALLNLGYSEETVKKILELQKAKQAVAPPGTTAIVTKEEMDQIAKAQKALDALKEKKDALTAAERKHTSELEKQQKVLSVNAKVQANAAKYGFAGIESKYNLPAGTLSALHMIESRGNAKAYNKETGATGGFQFLEGTAKQYGVKDRTDLAQSAEGAAKYMSYLLKLFKGDLEKAVRAYHAGEGNVMKGKGIGKNNNQYWKDYQSYMAGINGYSAGDISSKDFDKLIQDTTKMAEEQAKLRLQLENEVANQVTKIRYDLAKKLEDVDKANFSPERKAEIKAELQARADNDIAIAEQATKTKLDSFRDYTKTEEQILKDSYAKRQFEAEHDLDLTKDQRKEAVDLLAQQLKQELGLMQLAQEQRLFQARLSLLSETQAMQERYRLEREEILKNTKLSIKERQKLIAFSKANQDKETRDKVNNAVQNWGGIQADMNGTSEFFRQDQERFSRLNAANDLADSQFAATDLNEQNSLDGLDAQMEAGLIKQQDYENQKTAIIQAAQDQRNQIAAEHAKNVQDIEDKYQQDRLNTQIAFGGQMMGSLTSMFGSMFGEQSKAYKIMFAADKAYAIAAAGIAIQQNIAAASKAGFPRNIPLIAGAVAQGASIIANIRAIKDQGFADGGYTGSGGKYEPAGIVHKGEVVWSQEDIRRWGGVGLVENMRKSANPEAFINNHAINNTSAENVFNRSFLSSKAFNDNQNISNIFNQPTRENQIIVNAFKPSKDAASRSEDVQSITNQYAGNNTSFSEVLDKSIQSSKSFNASKSIISSLSNSKVLNSNVSNSTVQNAEKELLKEVSIFKDNGFADGGYTGKGKKYEIAGAVHKGEIVWSQDDIKKWGGVDKVEQMRRATSPESFVSNYAQNHTTFESILNRANQSSRIFNQSKEISNIFNKSVQDDQIIYNGNGNVPTSATSDLFHDGKVYFSSNGLVQDRSNLDDVQDFTISQAARPQAEIMPSIEPSTPTINFKIEVINQVSGATVEAEQLDEQTVRIIVTDELDKQLPRKVPKLVSDQIANPNSTISRSLTENTTARRNR
ncbi:tape measure protein [Acinetobacter baumannii]|uniref:tape measure protein n=17 Tax=Acinetobacter calcoaceticus/baumannii complex TaxID=909768 RepID=UPI001127C0F2|nr:tape measure protein [Acinetobacter baumannii]EIB6919411.1 tape measure protein [Acinetobacter baumannii]MZX47999.1 tape measure protein [Acinetobacter baumannii]TPT02606.1 tape measure protein [Acinetobacter baumannii]